MNEPYEIKLQNIFEGPMDLLVHLIKKNEVDIYDIPIALITDQYLAYIEWMKSMNIDFAGDFIVLAATLAHIKSIMLLPRHEREEVDEDPRLEIARPLLEYIQMQSVAEQLAVKPFLGEHTFSRRPVEKKYADPSEGEYIKVGLFELIDAFQGILKNLSAEHRVDMTSDRITVGERITEITDMLEKKGSVTFKELFLVNFGKSHIIITFLAVLEMAKLCLIRIAQHTQNGTIRLFYV